MRAEKQLEAAAVPIHNWILSIIYVGKSTLFHDRQQERLKLIVSSSARTNQEQYMYIFEVGNSLADIGIKVQQAKDFKTLKEFFYYLKFNGQSIQFREVSGEGLLSVQYPNKRKEKPIAHIKGGTRLTVESKQTKNQRIIAIKEQQRIEKETLQAQKNDSQEPSYNPKTTLVVDHIDKIRTIANGIDEPTQQASKAKKIVLKYCQMDVNSPECEMKNDREIDRRVMQKILNLLPKLQKLQEISVQWHKLSTSKAIEDVLKACEKLPQIKVINFDNQGNAFDKSFFKTINQSKHKQKNWQKLEEISSFFNISDEDDYFQESWWHPQHTEKYKGKDPIQSQQWEAFANIHKNLNSVWIPRNGENDIRLLAIRSWKKLALGYYQDQRMKAEYWKAMKDICESRGDLSPNRLISLCLTRIKDIDDEALSIIIANNSHTLQNFTLCWCDNETDQGLQGLAICESIKSISIRHSPLQENINVTCSFLSSLAMKNLRSLCVQNFKKARDNILQYLQSENSSNLRSLSLPRNEWVGQNIWDKLGNREKLIKLNLYNNKLLVQKDHRPVSKAIKKMKMLRVLNIGATELELLHIPEILAQLPRIRKLNISDRKTNRNISKNFYENNWSRICYPTIDKDTKKPYQKLDNNQKKEFLLRISNQQITKILEKIPRATHLDIRNLGGDERPFANLKLAPNIRFIGCEFELYKQIQGLDRRGITFV